MRTTAAVLAHTSLTIHRLHSAKRYRLEVTRENSYYGARHSAGSVHPLSRCEGWPACFFSSCRNDASIDIPTETQVGYPGL